MPIDEPPAREIDAQIQQWSEWFGVPMDEKAASGLRTMIHRYAASNEARLQREVEALRAEKQLLGEAVIKTAADLERCRKETLRLISKLALTPPAASEEDAS